MSRPPRYLTLLTLAAALVSVPACTPRTASLTPPAATPSPTTAEPAGEPTPSAVPSTGSPSAEETGQATVPEPAAPATPDPAPKTERNFAFIRKVESSTSGVVIVADYAQFLTGDAAAKAASERGEESPPPNDYFIVNENKQLRRLRLAGNVKIVLLVNPDGTLGDRPVTYASADFAKGWKSASQDHALRQFPYWVSVKNGVVVRLEQQFLP